MMASEVMERGGRCSLAWAQTTHRLASTIMAWRCSGSTNIELIENMARNGLINSARVRNVRVLLITSFSISKPALTSRR